jgi:hypothetical protein
MGLLPLLQARSWRMRWKDYKWILSACHNINIEQYNKVASQYPEDSIASAFRFRTNRRPCGTEGRVSVNSTTGSEELSLLASPSASFSTRGLSSSVESLLYRAWAVRALFASIAVLGRRWFGRGMSGRGG